MNRKQLCIFYTCFLLKQSNSICMIAMEDISPPTARQNTPEGIGGEAEKVEPVRMAGKF